MAIQLSDLNWAAFGASVVTNVLVGTFWYNPKTPTGRTWVRLTGTQMDQRPPAAEMAKSMGLMLVGVVLLFFVFAHTFAAYEAAGEPIDVGNGLMGGFFLWLGFILPVQLNLVAFNRKPLLLLAVDAGYYLVVLLLAGLWFALLG